MEATFPWDVFGSQTFPWCAGMYWKPIEQEMAKTAQTKKPSVLMRKKTETKELVSTILSFEIVGGIRYERIIVLP